MHVLIKTNQLRSRLKEVHVLLTPMFTDRSGTSQQQSETQMEGTVSVQRVNLVWTYSSQGSVSAHQFLQ